MAIVSTVAAMETSRLFSSARPNSVWVHMAEKLLHCHCCGSQRAG
jgi:hypothetical protein